MSKLLEVVCTGSPHDVGFQHGAASKEHIARSMIFYQGLFRKNSKMEWDQVTAFAEKYQPYLEQNWPQYVAEMRGVAAGAGVPYNDILALNVRTEIAFGTFNDGCTSLSWLGEKTSLLAQNWDWNVEQGENLICLKIRPEKGPNVDMITEAGIIGKIGLNGKGVGCALNAIKAPGASFTKLPVHLALRTILESDSRQAAIATLDKAGVASACHILIADATGGTGLECSSDDIVKLEMNKAGIVTHTNHYVAEHAPSVKEAQDWLADTRFRLDRINELLNAAKEESVSPDAVERMLSDEVEGGGAAICRSSKKEMPVATLFSIVMDLGSRRARVIVGKPSSPVSKLILSP